VIDDLIEFGAPEPAPDNVIPFPRMRPNSALAERWRAAVTARNQKYQTSLILPEPVSVVDEIVRRRGMPKMSWPGGWPGLARRMVTYPGDMTGIVGSQGGGKTSFAIQVGISNTANGIPVLHAPLELDPPTIVTRIAGNGHNVHAAAVRDHWPPERLAHVMGAFSDMWHFVDRFRDPERQLQAFRISIEIAWEIYRVPPLLIVDHVGKLANGARDRKDGTMMALEQLREIAVDYQCFVLALSQGSRGNQPILTGKVDLDSATDALGTAADSRAFEEDCTNVVVLSLFKANDSPKLQGIAHVAKARNNGEEGDEGVEFLKSGGVWSQLDHIPPTPSEVKAETEKDKKEKRPGPARSQEQVRADLNVAKAGDADALRNAKIVQVVSRYGALGMDQEALRNTLGVGRGHAYKRSIQELLRAGTLEHHPPNKWRVVTRIE
jgi:hypothetical protein